MRLSRVQTGAAAQKCRDASKQNLAEMLDASKLKT
jgi:hypothetical protein